MSSRREFLARVAMLGAVTAIPFENRAATIQAGFDESSSPNSGTGSRYALRRPPRVRSVIRREETLLRLGGEGDNFHMSWGADDRQVVMVDDGWGWARNPTAVNNNRLFRICGSAEEASFEEVSGYPAISSHKAPAVYHGFGTLCVDGHIYQFLSNMFRCVKVIHSPDNGRTWFNQDGSTPVTWESKDLQSPGTMIFFEEPQNAFSLLSIVQMGRDYAANMDGYVYIYSPNGITEGEMNELVMCRVLKTKILDRRHYEYFTGIKRDGKASWSKDINARKAVHVFPAGWVNKYVGWRHPYAWHPSIVYNAPLGLYLMANWGNGCSPDGVWFSKPSYLGLWAAVHPWGPWAQIHEETAWTPGGDSKARAYQPQIPPKWISDDGKSFWLVWTDWQQGPEYEPLMLKAVRSHSQEESIRLQLQAKMYRPYYGFNLQRIDLVV